MTKVQLTLERLILDGFGYHDHKRIGAAFEKELARLIREGGLGLARSFEAERIAAPSFSVRRNDNPSIIGAAIARSAYKSVEKALG